MGHECSGIFYTYLYPFFGGQSFTGRFSEAKGAHPFLVYNDPLIFGGEINEIGAVLRKMVTHFVDSSVDRAIVCSLLFVVGDVRGRVVGG